MSFPIFTDATFRHRIQWFLFTVFFNAELGVCVTFWSVLFSKVYNGTVMGMLGEIFLHALPDFVGLLDFCFGATPFKLLHFVYPLCYTICYLAFTLIYWSAGGTYKGESYIYFMFDYSDNPGLATAMWFICCLAVIVTLLVLWGLDHFKSWLSVQYELSLLDEPFLKSSGKRENRIRQKSKCDKPNYTLF